MVQHGTMLNKRKDNIMPELPEVEHVKKRY